MKKILVISIVAIGIIALSYNIIASDSANRSNEDSATEVELKTNMRKLWEDHVMWTRNVIFNIMDDLPGKDQAVKRLLKNQDHIGNAIKPYYGDAAGKALTDLLYVHITTAADLLTAKKNDNDKAFKEANDKWLTNADEISAFLSKANPNWKLADMKMMMHDHLKLTTEEAMARKDKDYDADVAAYDKVHDEILKMSDMLSTGIMKQFPEKFKNNTTIGKK
ncbi:MAG: glycosyltransferase [Bacteroidota bacterium]